VDRYICIHSHFYQPPRENPWLEAVDVQDSAYPYHDWNERINAECYATNARSRILDEAGRIAQIVNNYEKISFNVGPTLLAWLQTSAPGVYDAILEADRRSMERFGGHGSAMAQAYNHMIMPLATTRDRRTQVAWGIADFRRRFGRAPQGMWLPETAVDLETLDLLAAAGITFTVLAPHQAARTRSLDGGDWQDVSGGGVDPTVAYAICLPSGRQIAAFFYDGPISRAVAFEGLLDNGERFAQRLLGAFHSGRAGPQLVSIATDGETYGHHHRFGEMALAYALHRIEHGEDAALTNYGAYLAAHPPTHEAELVERTSWSCAHGVDRWWRDCGDNTGAHPGWTQAWRTPLREALDWLRDALADPYERAAGLLLRDPWAARDDYIRVILDRSDGSLEAFFRDHATRELDDAGRVAALRLLELQRHTLLMYTSCGWFFDELSGIETVQVIQYAGRAVQLAGDALGLDLERDFLDRLERAKSNLSEFRDGARVYERFVRPARVTPEGVGAHYAISSLFESYPDRVSLYCFTADRTDYRRTDAGRARLAVGQVTIRSVILRTTHDLVFAVLHLGDHNFNGGVRAAGSADYAETAEALQTAFTRGDVADVIRAMDRAFGESTYALPSLFKDEQRKVLALVLDATLAEVESAYRQIYERHTPLMNFLAELRAPLPAPFHAAAAFVINDSLARVFAAPEFDSARARALLDEAAVRDVTLDLATLEFTLRRTIEQLMAALAGAPDDPALFDRIAAALDVGRLLPVPVNVWQAQNAFFDLLQREWGARAARAAEGDAEAARWVERCAALGAALSVRVP
jgi:alpha-amylase/alpha-mannosidase (GH57 family)